MEFPETVLTKGKKGALEVRSLDSRGHYVVCKYLDPKTMKPADAKRKLILRDNNENVIQYFIIPLKNSKRALLISAEPEEKDRQVWNEAVQKAEEIWED
jgi:hypothetical protein